MLRKHLLISFFVFAFSINLQAQHYGKWTIEECKSHVKTFTSFWIKDSLADNGYRMMLYFSSFFSEFTLKGKKWSEWEAFWGKPNKKIHTENTTDYLYKLTNFGNSFWDDIYLVIMVNVHGEIESFRQIEPCG